MPHASLALLLLLSLSATGRAQGPALTRCDGQIVSRVVIEASPPPFSGAARRWRAAANAVGLHHATTRSHVIEAYLSLEAGKPCTELRRAETERVLRTQPFLLDAKVRITPDGEDSVAVIVTTTDEVPVLIGGRFRGITPEQFVLGNDNVGGEALHLEGRIERGGAYRTAIGGRMLYYAFAGRPYRLALDGDRYRLGGQVSAQFEHPFYTDLQWISWHTGVAVRDDYLHFERPALDPLALKVRDRSWDASSLVRLFGTRTVALLGGAVLGRQFDPAATGIVVDDTGLRADTGTALQNRYRSFHAVRVGIIGGLRRVTFQTVSGFDALVGSQDVMKGAMLGVYVAKGLPKFGENDVLVSSALYAGAAKRNMLLATLAQAEIRRDLWLGEWNSAIGSARSTFYLGSAPGIVFNVDNQLSGGWESRLPLQLTFRDRNGGLIGYRNSGLAGARRSVTHTELRWSEESLYRRADFGFAVFSEVGHLWKGDVPYGVTATRTSVGVSLLAAYPSRGKRLYRADIGIPVARSGFGSGRVEVRFSSLDRTQAFWREPVDVERARTGAEPSRFFAWPTQ
jgi:hypothetical protein